MSPIILLAKEVKIVLDKSVKDRITLKLENLDVVFGCLLYCFKNIVPVYHVLVEKGAKKGNELRTLTST